MSKYDTLWAWFREKTDNTIELSFEDINEIAGFPLDHSFLRYKKELMLYGYCVEKISMKENRVRFQKLSSGTEEEQA